MKSKYLDSLLDENEDDLIIDLNNIKYHITTSFNQNNKEYDNISTIILGECENILKKEYNISYNDYLLIFKIDIIPEYYSLRQTIYEIYNSKTKDILNLTYCENVPIIISYPVSVNEKELNKYNPSSEFYNNFCIAYSTESGTDITLKDRQNEFNDKNLSLCDDNCRYNNYNYDSKKESCECFIKYSFPLIKDVEINKDKLKQKFVDVKNAINIKVVKCYKYVFFDGLIKNIDNYILLFIILIFIINSNIFYCKENKILQNKIIILQNLKNKNIRKRKNNKIKKKSSPVRKKKGAKGGGVKNKTKNSNLTFLISNNTSNSKSLIKLKKLNNNSKNRHLFNSQITLINNNSSINNIENNINKIYSFELNELDYKKAIIFDKRTYIEFYISLLKSNHPLIFIFNPNDYNSKAIKLCLFIFSFSLYYTINALFFNESSLHQIYLEKGEFNFVYQIPQIIYSTMISSLINSIIKYLSLSQKTILDFKSNNKKMSLIIQQLKIKFILFFILSYILLLFFWYYLSCFYFVYKNTGIYLLKDTLISFGLSLLYPFGLFLIPGIFRMIALKDIKQEKKCLYNFSLIIQILL